LYDKETKYITAMTNAIVEACSVAADNFLYIPKCFTNLNQMFHHHYRKIPLHPQLLCSWISYFCDNSKPSIMLLRLHLFPSSFFYMWFPKQHFDCISYVSCLC